MKSARLSETHFFYSAHFFDDMEGSVFFYRQERSDGSLLSLICSMELERLPIKSFLGG